MINVTKAFLPPFEDYSRILQRAWEKAWLTNNGELVQELEQKLKTFLGVKNFLLTNNGTVVLQMALKALGVTKEVITTPFSYVATTNAILWEGCTPVFVDINPQTFCIDPAQIEQAITENTQAILATHVYGLPCDVEEIEAIAQRHGLKVIYDGAHAFGCQYKGKALLNYGDISTCSFHATKLFHTVEGGCIICPDDEVNEKVYLFRQFGHIGDDYYSIGINGKSSEFHAAMGLAVLPHLPGLIEARKALFMQYNALLQGHVRLPFYELPDFEYNYSYYPVVFEDEATLVEVKEKLMQNNIYPRRYFYPSLNTLPFLSGSNQCPVSEDISSRVLCLPLYHDLQPEEVERIAGIIVRCLEKNIILQK
jgi:dTDP-4-amino-4,6-dideoxygalactose transaminase